MLDTSTTGATTNTSYVYDASKGTATKGTATTGDKTTNLDISTWGVDDKVSGDDKLGDKTAKTWTVVLDTAGSVAGYSNTY